MARIPDTLFNDFIEGQTVHAADYTRERELMRVAINDFDDKVNSVIPVNAQEAIAKVPVLETGLASTNQQVASLASGSPKGVYATVSALQTAFSTGNSSIYLVTGNVKEVDTLNITAAPTAAGNITVTLNGVATNIAVTSGVKEVASLTVTAAPTTAGNVTITLNGVAKTVALDPSTDTTTDLVATKIRNAVYSTGAVTGGTASTVTFTAAAVGVKTDATYSAGTTGATGTMSTTTQGVDADTTTSVATKIRGTAFTGWTTGGTGTSITFTKTTAGTNTAPSYSAGTTGSTGTMSVTTAGANVDGNWYYWNGSAWTAGGIYQSAGISDNSIEGVGLVQYGISIDHVNNPIIGTWFTSLNSNAYVYPFFKFPNMTITPTDTLRIEFKVKFPVTGAVTALKSFIKTPINGLGPAKNNSLTHVFRNHVESKYVYEAVPGVTANNEELDIITGVSLSSSGVNFELFIYDVKVAINGTYYTPLAFDGTTYNNMGNTYSLKDYPYKIVTNDMLTDYATTAALNNAMANTASGKYTGKTIFCLGDSLTEGDYGSSPPGTKNIKAENLPYFLASLLGATTANHGKSGYSTTSYWDIKLKTINFSTANAIVIMLGTNGGLTDTLVADTTITTGQTYENYANTNTGNYAKIIEYCLAQTGGILPIFLVQPPFTQTQLPATSTTVHNVINQLGVKYSLPVIDVMYESGLSIYNRSTVQPLDGTHFNRQGYEILASYIASQMLAKFRTTGITV